MSTQPYTSYGQQQQAQQAQEPGQGQPNVQGKTTAQGQVAPPLSAAHAQLIDQASQDFTAQLQQELQARQQALAENYTKSTVQTPGQEAQQAPASAMDMAQAQVAQFLQSMGHTPESFFNEAA